jgi:quinol monooxygenase YgiN
MTIGVIATIKVLEGKNSEFEAAFATLTEQVLANEEGTLFYALNRSKTDGQVYKVLEQYRSEADVKAHGQTDYFKAANKVMAACVAAAPEIEMLEGV